MYGVIHRLSVSTYLSIAVKAELDLRIPRTAPDMPGFRESKARAGVPSLVLLLGPNASGKTNLLTALVRLLQIVAVPFGV